MSRPSGSTESIAGTLANSSHGSLVLETPFPLLSLPFELLIEVTSHLPPEFVAALALTCATLYHSRLSPFKASMSKQTKILLLQLLERQFPTHFLCHRCVTYHALTAVHEPHKYISVSLLPEQRCEEKSGYIFYHQYFLCLLHVRAAVRHTLLGPDHGIAPAAFSHEVKLQLHGRLSVSQSMRARVIGGELYLAGAYAFSGWEEPSAGGPWGPGVGRKIGVPEWRICPHVVVKPALRLISATASTTLERLLIDWLPEAAKYGSRGVRIARAVCEYCYTDFTFALKPECETNVERGTRLIACFYRNLGPGYSPEDPRWQAAAQGHSMPAQRVRAAEESTIIMDAWDADEEAEYAAQREARQAANEKAEEDARWESVMKLETEEPAMDREENTASSTGGARSQSRVRVAEEPAPVPPHLHKRILGKIARVVRLGICTRKK